MKATELKKTAALVRQWAIARNITAGSDAKTQTLKTVSEFGELSGYIRHEMAFVGTSTTEVLNQIIDGIGDTMVTQIIVCEQLGVDFDRVIDLVEVNADLSIRSVPQLTLNCSRLLGLMADNVLKNQVQMFGLNLSEFLYSMKRIGSIRGIELHRALEYAYDEIKDRRGVMYNGTFIKSDDPRYVSACAEIGVQAE